MLAYTDYALFLAALPFAVWATYSDLRYMKITNISVLIMTAVFLVVGAIFLPFDIFLWRVVGGLIVLAIGIILFALRSMGGGDAKFGAAMALFVDHDEILEFIFILALVTLVAVVSHYIVGKLKFASPITGVWKSWKNAERKFALGYGMGGALLYYLTLKAFF